MKVSICCITYNHEKFIEETLKGFLSQDYQDYEIIVSDDCSKDRTPEILKAYKDKYPDKIKLLLNEKNMGMMPNFIQALRGCKGEYIALCEGDDFWIDSNKLSKQLNFLESNSVYAMVSHNVYVKHQNTDELVKFDFNKVIKENKNDYNTNFIIKNWGLYTCSFVFKNDFDLPNWFKTIKAGDLGLTLLLSLKGKIAVSEDCMAVYRKHESGNTANAAHIVPMHESVINLLRNFNVFSEYKFDRVINKRIKELQNVVNILESKNFISSFWFAFQLPLINGKLTVNNIKKAYGYYKNWWNVNHI